MGRIFYECRDLDKPSGGVRRLYRHVEVLTKHGYDAAVLHHRPGFAVKWFLSSAPVAYSDSTREFEPEDVLVIPEGHPDVMVSTALLPCRRVVIALNWANIYAALPIGLDWRHIGLEDIIAGSDYEREFIKRTMGLDSTVIVSGIDTNQFRPSAQKVCQVAFMPRKNRNVFHLIASAFRSRFPEHANVPFVPIDSLTHEQVARALANSAIFLATSFPEGLARPPLEAMASGCIVVGFAGRGSLEYMRHLDNCFLVEDMDVLAAAEQLGAAVSSFKNGTLGPMQSAARSTALAYSLEREERSVVQYWREFLSKPAEPPASRCPANDKACARTESLRGDSRPEGPDGGPARDLGFSDVYDRAVASAPQTAVFVEIGTSLGASTAYLAAQIGASSKNIHVFAVDTFAAIGSAEGLQAQVAGVEETVFHLFCENMRTCCAERYITPILSDSTLSARRFPDHSVDFVYIRVGHDYSKVRAHILAWLPKVKPGGVIAGHDYDESHPGVMRAVREAFVPGAIETTGRSWLIADPCEHRPEESGDNERAATDSVFL